MAALRSGKIHRSVTRRHIGDMNIPVGGTDLPFEPLLYEIEIPAGGGDEVAVFADPRNSAVVENDATLITHEGVTHAPRRQIGKAMCVHFIEQLPAVSSPNVELAERTHINQPGRFADGAVFKQDTFFLARGQVVGVVAWPLPVTHVQPHDAQILVRVMHGGASQWMMLRPRQRTEAHSRIRRTRSGHPRLADRAASLAGTNSDRRQLAHASLAGTHRRSRVAF